MDDKMKEEITDMDKIVRMHVSQLGEHFDAVHIFCSKHAGDEKGSFKTSWGSGNYYTRYGQIKHWIVGEEAATSAEEYRSDNS